MRPGASAGGAEGLFSPERRGGGPTEHDRSCIFEHTPPLGVSRLSRNEAAAPSTAENNPSATGPAPLDA